MLLYDDYFVFVIILRAKAPSLVTYDEARNFIIESACSVTKFVSVTTESSLMNTFLVVFTLFCLMLREDNMIWFGCVHMLSCTVS